MDTLIRYIIKMCDRSILSSIPIEVFDHYLSTDHSNESFYSFSIENKHIPEYRLEYYDGYINAYRLFDYYWSFDEIIFIVNGLNAMLDKFRPNAS